MKKVTLLITILLISTNLVAQTVWNQVWNMQQMPFQAENIGSEMSIVKSGFDTDQDGWGEFICGNSDFDKSYIMMYEASANDSYELVWYWEFSLATNTFPGFAVGDIDNNGIVEIVVGLPSVVS